MEYVTGKRQVVMNFSEKFCKTEVEVLNSKCFNEVWTKYIDNLYKTENQAFLPVLNIFPRAGVVEYTTNLFKLLFAFDIEEIKEMDKLYAKALAKKEVLYDLVQHFYDYWRRLERYAVVLTRNVKDGVESTSFINAQSEFNNTILSTYRGVSEKLFGAKFPVYRQLPAGVNAALLLSKNEWMDKDSEYAFLRKCDAIEQIVIRPPFISYSAKNKRTGTYPEAKENPINWIKDNFKANEYYCYAARVGSSLTYVYFHRDYLAHGITICNLFEFVPLSEIKGQKPDCLYIFGADYDDESYFYYDVEGQKEEADYHFLYIFRYQQFQTWYSIKNPEEDKDYTPNSYYKFLHAKESGKSKIYTQDEISNFIYTYYNK